MKTEQIEKGEQRSDEEEESTKEREDPWLVALPHLRSGDWRFRGRRNEDGDGDWGNNDSLLQSSLLYNETVWQEGLAGGGSWRAGNGRREEGGGGGEGLVQQVTCEKRSR